MLTHTHTQSERERERERLAPSSLVTDSVPCRSSWHTTLTRVPCLASIRILQLRARCACMSRLGGCCRPGLDSLPRPARAPPKQYGVMHDRASFIFGCAQHCFLGRLPETRPRSCCRSVDALLLTAKHCCPQSANLRHTCYLLLRLRWKERRLR